MNEQQLQKTKTTPALIAVLVLVTALAVTVWVLTQNTSTVRDDNQPAENENTNISSRSLVNANPISSASLQQPVEQWTKYTNTTEAYSFSYPSNWVLREYQRINPSSNTIEISSDEKYPSRTDVYTEGFEIVVSVNKDAVETATPDEEALKMEGGREALPLVKEQFTTINGLSVYRAYREFPRGALGLSGEINTLKRTTVEYTLRKKNDLFRIWLQIDSEEPENVITNFDRLVKTFSVS